MFLGYFSQLLFFVAGEYGSVVSGQLNNVRTDVMSGSQSVTIKMLTGINKCTFFFLICVCKSALYECIYKAARDVESYSCMSIILLSGATVGLPEGSRRDEVVRFLEAATLMKGIKHRNIVPVLRVSVEDNYVPLVIYPMVEHFDMYRVIKLASDPEHSVLPVSLVNSSINHGPDVCMDKIHGMWEQATMKAVHSHLCVAEI